MMPGYVGLIPRGASMRYPVKIRLTLIDAILPVIGKDESLLILSSGREIELDESPTKVEARIEEAREVAERHEREKMELADALRLLEDYREAFPKQSSLARTMFGRRRTG